MEPRLTLQKIQHIARVDRGEKFAPAFSDAEMRERVDHELLRLRELQPVAVVTGSYVTIPIACQVLQIPLAWVIQSTWLEGFFRHGAGTSDRVRPQFAKAVVNWFIWAFVNFWIRYGCLNAVNRAATHYGVPGVPFNFRVLAGPNWTFKIQESCLAGARGMSWSFKHDCPSVPLAGQERQLELPGSPAYSEMRKRSL